MRIVVTAGYGKSLHATALIRCLAEAGHAVPLVLCTRILDLARFRAYSRRLGLRGLLRRARSRLLGGASGGETPGELKAMLDFLVERRISSRTVQDASKAVGARLLFVKSLNAQAAIAALRRAEPDLIAYAGGGILRRELIEVPKIGVLNCHGGPLPHFRGMNAAEWSLFYGVQPCLSVHFIDPGVDTGPMLFERPLPTDIWENLEYARGVATRLSVEALLEAVDLIATNRISRTPQEPAAGRQFFVMADPLVEVLTHWIAEGRTPKGPRPSPKEPRPSGRAVSRNGCCERDVG